MLIKVKVLAEAKTMKVAKISEDTLKADVKESPRSGMANKQVIELLASYFAVPSGKIRLIKGARCPHKIFDIGE